MIEHILYWGSVAVMSGIATACIFAIIMFVSMMVEDFMAD